MLDRTISERLRSYQKNVLLLGPRQVGKSTLVRSLRPQLIINLADEALYLSYSKDPTRLRREITALKQPGLVFIDEIQRVPQLLNTLQALLDESKKQRFILSGSSARKIKRGGANLLPGRVILEYLDPLSIWELKERFDLDKVLQRGSLPEIYLDEAHGAEILDTYATTYLREEIQAEAVIRNIGDYARFLDAAAEGSGSWVNYSKISSDTEIAKETIRRFYQMLEDTLLAYRIPAFKEKNSKRRVSQRDRFIFFDVGVRNALLGIHRQKLSPMDRGIAFEQWFILQVIYFIHSQRKDWKIYSYRTDTDVEVDLICDTGKELLAIECKTAANVHESDAKHLQIFSASTKRKVQCFIVYHGQSQQKMARGPLALSYRDFLLKELPKF